MSIVNESILRNVFNSEKLITEQVFPELICKLIQHSAGNELKSIRIPYGDFINKPGYDGEVRCQSSRFNVPDGLSLWEIGTSSDCYTKITSDYQKRTDSTLTEIQSNSTLVLVASDIWNKPSMTKQNWIQSKKAESSWRDVIVIDFIDILEWLNQCVDIAVWLLRKFSLTVNLQIDDIRGAWKRIQALTIPALTSSFLLYQRDDFVTSLFSEIEQLTKSKMILDIGASSRREAFFVTIAAILERQDEDSNKDSLLIVAYNLESYDYLKRFNKDYTVLCYFDFIPDEYTQVPTICFQSGKDIKIEDRSIFSFKESLSKWGIVENDTKLLMESTKANFDAAIRFQKSPYFEPNDNPILTNPHLLWPLVFLKSYDHRSNVERDVVSRIAGVAIDDYDRQINILVRTLDSPIVRRFETYTLIDRARVIRLLRGTEEKFLTEVCTLLVDYFSDEEISRFSKIDYGVLSNNREYPYESSISSIIDSLIHIGNIHESLMKLIQDQLYVIFQRDPSKKHFMKTITYGVGLAELFPRLFMNYLDHIVSSTTFIKDAIKNDQLQYYGFQVGTILSPLGLLINFKECISKGTILIFKVAQIEFECLATFRSCDLIASIFLPYYRMIDLNLDERKLLLSRYVNDSRIHQTMKKYILKKLFPEGSAMFSDIERPQYQNEKFSNQITYAEYFDFVGYIMTLFLGICNEIDLIDLVEAMIHFPDATNVLIIENIKRNGSQLSLRTLLKIVSSAKKVQRNIRYFSNSDNWKVHQEQLHFFDEVIGSCSEFLGEQIFMYPLTFKEHEIVLESDTSLYDEKNFHHIDHSKEISEWFQSIIDKVRSSEHEDFVESVVEISEDSSYLGAALAKHYDMAHFDNDVKCLGNKSLRHALYAYLHSIPEQEYEKLVQVSEVIQGYADLLPFNDLFLSYFDGTGFEQLFWGRRIWRHISKNNTNFEIILKKFLQFNPLDLAETIAYDRDESLFPYVFSILKQNVDLLLTTQNHSVMLIDPIQKIIQLLENSGYHEQLALIELRLIGVYELRGIHKSASLYFLKNPFHFVALFESRNNIDAATSRSRTILENWHIQPSLYSTNSDDIDSFASAILVFANRMSKTNDKSELMHYFGKVFCEAPSEDGIWPTKRVAKIIEDIENDDFDNALLVSRLNQYGVRTITKGDHEKGIAQKYLGFARHYQWQYPRTSELLRNISRHFAAIGDSDFHDFEKRLIS